MNLHTQHQDVKSKCLSWKERTYSKRVIEKTCFHVFELTLTSHKMTFTGNKRLRNSIYEKLNFYFFEMLIQNTHLKFKAYIAQTIEKFLYKKGTLSLSRRFKAQQPVILPKVSHDSQHELEKTFLNAFGWKETTV